MASPFDELFTAVDVSALATKTSALMVGVIGVTLLFVGYGVVRKIMRRGA